MCKHKLLPNFAISVLRINKVTPGFYCARKAKIIKVDKAGEGTVIKHRREQSLVCILRHKLNQ